MSKDCDWNSLAHYDRLIGPIREKARELGYAVAVHGTLVRDIDLIAVPWIQKAVPARELAESIQAVVKEINGVAHLSWYPAKGREFTLDGGPGCKPHGRLGWVINLTMGAGPYIDLSVMPRSGDVHYAYLVASAVESPKPSPSAVATPPESREAGENSP